MDRRVELPDPSRRQRAMRTRRRLLPGLTVLSALAIVALLVAGCSFLTGDGAGGGQPSPEAVTTAGEAAAAVAARSPLFDGIGAKDPDVIGASAWWTAIPVGDASSPTGWTVTYEIGWGDCQAGCIDSHRWTYDVARDGTVAFREESGGALPDEVLVERFRAAAGPAVGGHVTAGPTCPVEQPGNPACAGRAVSGAVLVVRSGDKEIARVTVDGSGLYRIPLPEGDYTLEAQPVEGLMGTPAPAPFTVRGTALTPLDVSYDTGIR